MKTSLVIAGLVFLAQQPLRPGHYEVFGAGNGSCGEWRAGRSEPDHIVRLTWAQGFLSGAGWRGGKVRFADPDAVNAWIDDYCAQHPLDTLSRAAANLAVTLGG